MNSTSSKLGFESTRQRSGNAVKRQHASLSEYGAETRQNRSSVFSLGIHTPVMLPAYLRCSAWSATKSRPRWARASFVRKVRASGQEYVRNGHTIHLGNYVIDRIDSDGSVHAGCHVVRWEEIERIAPQLNAPIEHS